MTIKLVVYTTPTMSEVEQVITGFSNAREAAYYRDTHYETAGKPSQMQQDNGQAEGNNTDDMRDLNTDDGSTEQPRQVVQYYERTPFSLGKFIIAFIFVVVATVLMSPVIMFILFPQP